MVVMEGRRTKSTLVIKDVTREDSAIYQCEASNSLGKVRKLYRLVVEGMFLIFVSLSFNLKEKYTDK